MPNDISEAAAIGATRRILLGMKAPKEITPGSSTFGKQNVAQNGQALN